MRHTTNPLPLRSRNYTPMQWWRFYSIELKCRIGIWTVQAPGKVIHRRSGFRIVEVRRARVGLLEMDICRMLVVLRNEIELEAHPCIIMYWLCTDLKQAPWPGVETLMTRALSAAFLQPYISCVFIRIIIDRANTCSSEFLYFEDIAFTTWKVVPDTL